MREIVVSIFPRKAYVGFFSKALRVAKNCFTDRCLAWPRTKERSTVAKNAEPSWYMTQTAVVQSAISYAAGLP